MTLKKVQEYVKNYCRAVYRLRAMGASAPTEKRLKRYEESIDFRFPDEFREFLLSPMAGLCFEVSEELWPRTEDPADWRSLYSVKVFAPGFGVPPWLSLPEELAALPPEESDIVPFMAVGAELERYCFDLDHQIVRWSPSSGGREVLDTGFFELLMDEIGNLETRWVRYQEARPKKKKSRKRKKAKSATK